MTQASDDAILLDTVAWALCDPGFCLCTPESGPCGTCCLAAIRVVAALRRLPTTRQAPTELAE